MNWHTIFFLIGAFAACAAAVGMVFSRNMTRMAMLLVGSLGSVALLFFLAGADFVGALQLMVYVGGTLVLIIFGVMMTASGARGGLAARCMNGMLATLAGSSLLLLLLIVSGVLCPMNIDSAYCEAPVGCGGCERGDFGEGGDSAANSTNGTAVASTVDAETRAAQLVAAKRESMRENSEKPFPPTSGALGSALAGVRTDTLAGVDHEHCDAADETCHHTPGTGYMLPFEIVSVHLVVVLLAAAYLARAKKVRAEKQSTTV
ncbi:MAG: NADH-quinone oxidoreductase subunit J [Thermoguttaceae bacterium]|nr:NADH-quinone oxidoreductase subunit J [Thermoguttaceae bacterium]